MRVDRRAVGLKNVRKFLCQATGCGFDDQVAMVIDAQLTRVFERQANAVRRGAAGQQQIVLEMFLAAVEEGVDSRVNTAERQFGELLESLGAAHSDIGAGRGGADSFYPRLWGCAGKVQRHGSERHPVGPHNYRIVAEARSIECG